MLDIKKWSPCSSSHAELIHRAKAHKTKYENSGLFCVHLRDRTIGRGIEEQAVFC